MGDPQSTVLFEVKPAAYLKERKSAGGGAKPCVYVARENRRLADSAPESPAETLTGRYQEEEGDFTFHVNQAGRHIECWVAEVLDATKHWIPKTLLRLGGDLADDGSFSLYPTPDPHTGRGTLRRVGPDGELEVDFSMTEGRFVRGRLVRNSAHATVSKYGLVRLPGEQELVRAYEWAPLTRQWIRWLKDKLAPEHLDPLLKDFIDASDEHTVGGKGARRIPAKAINDYIGTIFATKPPAGWHPEDIPLARFHARCILAATEWTYNGVTRTYLDWLQVVLSVVAADRIGREHGLNHLKTELGLAAESDADPKRPPHKYRFTIEAAGVSIDLPGGGGSVMGGRIQVQKNTDPYWDQTYVWEFAGGGPGLGIGYKGGFLDDGTAETFSNWIPRDIPGPVSIVNTPSVQGGFGAGKSKGRSIFMVHGSGAHPHMSVDTGDTSDIFGVGIGVDVMEVAFGHIQALPAPKDRRKGPYVKMQQEYELSSDLQHQTDFRLGSALLTERARQELRVFCATELRAFRSAGGRLRIIGHADRLDVACRNEQLSELRTRNVLQAMRDILGDDFQIPDEHVELEWHGERKAADDGYKDETPSPQWRIVEIILNSQLVLTLRGE